jgi:hypothetical protein
MQILITDVTEMHQGNYCVAGWSKSAGRMIRPLPNGSNWTGVQLAKHGIQPGARIGFNATGAAASAAYPHRTEDLPIDVGSIGQIDTGWNVWFGVDAPPACPTLALAFENNVQTTGIWDGARKGAYVPEGTRIGSLSAVRVNCAELEFFENDYRGEKSLRAYVTDEDAMYSLPVVAKNLRELYRAKGATSVSKLLPKSGKLHVRVGLARAWAGQPTKCTAMINGVYL